MRRRLIAGNWKMYKTLTDTRAFFSSFLPLVAASKHCDIVVAPPFTAISTAVDAVKGSSVAISGQDVDWHKEGAFTGQIAPAMLAAWQMIFGTAPLLLLGVGVDGSPLRFGLRSDALVPQRPCRGRGLHARPLRRLPGAGPLMPI